MRLFISAGEASGDFLGSCLLQALAQKEELELRGIGGPLMAHQGLSSLFPMEELALMGVAEVLPKLWHLRKRLHETILSIQTYQPDAIVTLDAPGFHLRLIKKLKRLGVKAPCVHYVAPQVWAWKPGRARTMAQYFDHLLTLFPFEPPYFEQWGLPTTYVGHPLSAEVKIERDLTFRQRYGIDDQACIMTVLPGSRAQELAYLGEVFRESLMLLYKKFPNLHVLLPTFPHLKPYLELLFKDAPFPLTFLTGTQEKYAAFQESRCALAASGTVTLELALAGLPMVVAYRVSPVTYALAKFLVKVRYVSLANILLDQPLVPELLQNQCTPEEITSSLEEVLASPNGQREGLKRVSAMIQAPRGFETPSACAAEVIHTVVRQYRK